MRSISSQVKAASAVIMTGFLLFCGFLLLQLNGQITLSNTADVELDRQAEMAELSLTTKQIQIDIVQVQQFLTDVSATRGLNGLDDGPAEAARNADDFAVQMKHAREMAAKLKLDDLSASLARTDEAFPAYYATGKDMAKAYIDGGTEAGNAFMPQFDAASKHLYGELESVVAQAKAHSAAIAQSADKAAIASTGNARLSRTLSLVSGLMLLALTGAYAVYMLRLVVEPLSHFAAHLADIGRGLFDIRIQHTDRRNEVGDVARAIDGFRQAQIDARSAEATDMAGRQERRQRRERLENAIGTFRTRVASAMDGLHASATDMNTVSDTLSGISHLTSEQSRAAAAATHEATDNVQIVAAAAEELAASIADISEKIAMSQGVVRDAGQATVDSERNIARLAEASERIGAIVGLIQGVSSQTNLLALNATIEAARAGEAGKGFAVVASEVKALADQTARATHEIAQQIQGIQSETHTAVESIKAIAVRMGEVEEYSLAISAAVEEQSRATQEIAANVAQAAACTAHAQSNVAQLTEAAQQTSQSSGQVRDNTTRLSDEKDRLMETIDGFLSEVAA